MEKSIVGQVCQLLIVLLRGGEILAAWWIDSLAARNMCYHYHRPGDKKQLKAQDVTAKLVRVDILRMVPKNNLFCIKLT